jgi:hypothetical protein
MSAEGLLGKVFYSPEGDLTLAPSTYSPSLKFSYAQDYSLSVTETDAKSPVSNGMRVDAVFGIVKFLGPRYLCVVTKSSLVCRSLDGGRPNFFYFDFVL